MLQPRLIILALVYDARSLPTLINHNLPAVELRGEPIAITALNASPYIAEADTFHPDIFSQVAEGEILTNRPCYHLR